MALQLADWLGVYGDRGRCGTCGELPPHYCAPIITIRQRLGHRSVTITDRARPPAREPASEPPGWQPGFVVDVSGLLDYCEAIEPEWDREAAMGAGF